MHRIVAGITDLAQHIEALSRTPERYRPQRCPHCGISRVWGHGHYYRKADLEQRGEANANPVQIPRYCCAGCGQTCSRLPQCIAPRRWYNWLLQQISVRAVIDDSAPSASPPGPLPARRTVGRWWRSLQMRTPQFRFYLSSRYPELGRFVLDTDFWRAVFAGSGLSAAMTLLDQEIGVP